MPNKICPRHFRRQSLHNLVKQMNKYFFLFTVHAFVCIHLRLIYVFILKYFLGEDLGIVLGILEGVSMRAVFVKFAVLVLEKYEK